MDLFSRGGAVLAASAKIGFVCVLLSLAPVGCKSLPQHAEGESAETEPVEADQSAADLPAHDEAKNPGVAALASDAWYEHVQPPFAPRDADVRRWRHRQLDAWLRPDATNRPDLTDSLASSNPIVAGNAAIVAGHAGIGDPTSLLLATIDQEQARNPLRCAAVEALARVPGPATPQKIRELLDTYGGMPDEKSVAPAHAPNSDLHADLLRALARHAQAGDERYFGAALRNPVWNVRYEAIAGWTALADQPLPMKAIDLRSDPDPRVRVATLRTIAAHRDPHAIEYLQQALSDRSLEVQSVAIAGLGSLGGDEARALLTKLKGHRSELSRAASIAALAALGVRDEVEGAAKDTSAQVRRAVAQSLAQAAEEGRQIAAQTVATAQDLARDASNEVQQHAIDAIETWPLEQAGPVLLLAIAEGGYTARKAAVRQLAARWPAAAEFPVDAVPQRRAAVLAELNEQWRRQFGAIDDAVVAAKAEAQELIALSDERVREIRGTLDALKQANLPEQARREAISTLQAAGPRLVTYLDQELQARGALPRELFDEVLPNVNATFALLQRMTSRDLMQRRAAAAELAAAAASETLSPLALDRLGELLEAEKDPVIWRSALSAVANDSRETAVRMAYTAIGNSAAEVRCQACQYLARHGAAQHAAVLLPALDDVDPTVVLSAARALGSLGTLDDPRPLVQLLGAPNKHLRLEAAISLTRLHFQQGVAALERLGADADLEVRVRTAQAMGEIADRALLPRLIAMLSDVADVQRVALLSLAQIAGSDVAAAEDGTLLSNDEKVRRWQLWYRQQQLEPQGT